MKLKLCPFCGNEASLEEKITVYYSDYWVECYQCGIATRREENAEKAIEYWNNRSTKQIIELLDELIETAEYWSEYDVPIGLHDRIKQARELLD